MLVSLRFLAITIVLFIATLSQTSEALKLGTPYGADSRWAPRIGRAKVQWYHHWQDGPIAQMPKHVKYFPMFWGPKYNHLWAQRKKWIRKHKPKFILSLNEPDVEGQANVSPKEAARLHMRELEPFRRKGHKVSSPQIVWNTKWMDSFLKHIRRQGGDIDFIAAHYYGSWKDVGRYQKWIKTLRSKYKKSIWITEYGVTAKSGGSQRQIKAFQRKVNAWMRSKKYIKRVAWLGCFAVSKPPDAFASRQNALFSSHGKLRSIGYQYVYGSGNKRDEIDAENDDDDENFEIQDYDDDDDDDDVDESHDEDQTATGVESSQATPGHKRHALQHHRRIINLQQAADLQRRNESVTATSINGYPATAEEVQEYLDALKDEDKDDDENNPLSADNEDCDEICRLRDGETDGTDLDDDDKLHQ